MAKANTPNRRHPGVRRDPAPLKRRLAAALLAVSGGTIAHAGSTQFVADLPFTDCRGLICVQLALDDAAPRTLLLDTGNVSSSVIDDVARELGWTLEPMQRNGKAVPGVQHAGRHRVRLAATADGETAFLAFERSLFGDDPPPIDGTLAYTFFKDRVLQIDYPHHRLRISAPIAAAEPGTRLPGTLELITFGKAGPPIVVGGPFTLDGKSIRAQIDTAFTGTLLVYDRSIDALGLRPRVAHGVARYFPDTDGGVTLLGAPDATFGFDHQAIASAATVYFSGSGKNPVHQPDGLFEATVGNALFAHSVVTLDFHTMTLDVAPI